MKGEHKMTAYEEMEQYDWDGFVAEDLDKEFEQIADDFMAWKYEAWRNQYESIA